MHSAKLVLNVYWWLHLRMYNCSCLTFRIRTNVLQNLPQKYYFEDSLALKARLLPKTVTSTLVTGLVQKEQNGRCSVLLLKCPSFNS